MKRILGLTALALLTVIGGLPCLAQRPGVERVPQLPGRPTLRGIDVRKIPVLTRRVEQAETSVAAFVGATASGPANSPVDVRSFAEYTRTFGGLDPSSPVSYAVRLFFDNGGRQAWVVRAHPATLPGGAAARTGIYALEGADPVNILCIPEVSDPAVIAAAEQYCSGRRAFLLIDPPASADTPAAVKAWLAGPNVPRTRNCATYFPWLNAPDGRACGPSGAVAGVYARTDATRGVWKAPAGTEAELRGVASLSYALTNADAVTLNPLGINALRTMPTTGLVVWGTRTLSTDPEWKYVPVRRFALMIEESVDEGTEWAVFEPNEAPTWQQIEAHVGSFLLDLWRRGALQGRKAEEAYFVRCDATTTTSADVAAGRINILVGVATIKPAEFIILSITKEVAAP